MLLDCVAYSSNIQALCGLCVYIVTPQKYGLNSGLTVQRLRGPISDSMDFNPTTDVELLASGLRYTRSSNLRGVVVERSMYVKTLGKDKVLGGSARLCEHCEIVKIDG